MNITIFLQQNGIAYQRVEHPPVYTCEEAERLVPFLSGAHTKNLFLRDAKGRRHVLVVVDHVYKCEDGGGESALWSNAYTYAHLIGLPRCGALSHMHAYASGPRGHGWVYGPASATNLKKKRSPPRSTLFARLISLLLLAFDSQYLAC